MNNQDRLIIDKEQLNDLVNSCQEEIRRLKDRIDFYEDIESDRLAYIDELEKENQRLNSVLNELEKYFIGKFNTTQDTKYLDDLKYLKELKESDK